METTQTNASSEMDILTVYDPETYTFTISLVFKFQNSGVKAWTQTKVIGVKKVKVNKWLSKIAPIYEFRRTKARLWSAAAELYRDKAAWTFQDAIGTLEDLILPKKKTPLSADSFSTFHKELLKK